MRFTRRRGDLANRIELYKPDHDQLMVTPTLQPYFKLHGSVDLKASDREMMLILGGNKIQKHARLTHEPDIETTGNGLLRHQERLRVGGEADRLL